MSKDPSHHHKGFKALKAAKAPAMKANKAEPKGKGKELPKKAVKRNMGIAGGSSYGGK